MCDEPNAAADALRAAYERVRPLVYGAFPSFDAVVERVRAHAALLLSDALFARPSGPAWGDRPISPPGLTLVLARRWALPW